MRKLLVTILAVVLMSGTRLPQATASPADPIPPRAQVEVRSPAPPGPVETDGTARANLGAPPSDGVPALSVEEPHQVELDVPLKGGEIIGPRTAAAGWVTIVTEDFEGAFPSGDWSVFDNDGSVNGEFYWDEDDYKPHSGGGSAWAANGGANGLDPEVYYYPNYAQSWMVYGSFDLSDASDAELLFYYWNQSEISDDWFGWYASKDGTHFYGSRTSGDSGGWRSKNFDLTAVPTIGDVTGDPSVWIAFVFTSDGSNVDDGPFVDDITLRKYTSGTEPNLKPHTPSGWASPIVPSSAQGTHTVDQLCADGNTYVDWAVVNEGASTLTRFYTTLYVDDAPLQTWTTDGLDQGWYTFVEDWLLPPDSLVPGWHTLKIVADVYDDVAESNETDNVWEHDFYWDTCATPPSWLLLYYMSNGGNLEDGCETKFRAIAQEANNPDFRAWVLWDHVSGEDRVYRMKDNSDWENGYVHNVDYWTATDIGLGSAEMDTGDVNTLNAFVDFVLARQQADHYALIIFNHGGGVHPTVLGSDVAITGICFDDDPSSYLSVQELGQGTAHLAGAIGRNFEILHLDACLMQMIEINHEVHSDCDYVIASENEGWTWTSGTSWEADYLDDITSTSTAGDLANSVAAAYYNDMASYGATMSVLRTSYTGGVATAVDGLADALINHLRMIRGDLQSARNDAQKFAYYDGDNTMTQSNIFLDLRDFAEEVNGHVTISEVNDAASAVIDAVGSEGGDFVRWEAHHNDAGASPSSGYWFDAGTYGVSLFFPESVSPSGQNVYYNYVNDSGTPSNLAFCSSTQWDEFLRAYLEWKVLKASSSGASGVDIACTLDELGRGNGTTTFTRLYKSGASVSLTAPVSAGGLDFVRWDRDGSSYSTDRSISFSMSSDYDFEVIYELSNTPPDISGLPDQGLDEDDSLDDAIDLWAYASDVETPDTGLTFTIDNTPAPNAGVSVDANHYVDINPVADWYGTTSVHIKVEDPEGAFDTDAFSVTVNAVNDAPWIEPQVPDRSADEDEDISIDLTAHEHDVESSGTGLDWTASEADHCTVSGENSDDDVLTFTPEPHFYGSDVVTLTLTDGGGASASQPVTLTWLSVNDAPVIGGLPDQSLDEDTALDDAIDLWAYASDVETPDTGLTFTIDNAPDPNAGVSVDSNRYVDINPAADWHGTTSVRIKVEDPEGAFDIDTFQVTINYYFYLPLVHR
jgi:hypothetical protein